MLYLFDLTLHSLAVYLKILCTRNFPQSTTVPSPRSVLQAFHSFIGTRAREWKKHWQNFVCVWMLLCKLWLSWLDLKNMFFRIVLVHPGSFLDKLWKVNMAAGMGWKCGGGGWWQSQETGDFEQLPIFIGNLVFQVLFKSTFFSILQNGTTRNSSALVFDTNVFKGFRSTDVSHGCTDWESIIGVPAFCQTWFEWHFNTTSTFGDTGADESHLNSCWIGKFHWIPLWRQRHLERSNDSKRSKEFLYLLVHLHPFYIS